jgi:hypothetical protein
LLPTKARLISSIPLPTRVSAEVADTERAGF